MVGGLSAMKFTLGWLKDASRDDAPLDEIADTLTMIGLEVEGVEDRAAKLAPFTVGYVVEAKPHPDADRLRVCIVDTGQGEGPGRVRRAQRAHRHEGRVRAGRHDAFPAPACAQARQSSAAQVSNGMLCSAREMGLCDEHDGIIDLPADAPVGEPFAKVLGLDDPVIDVAVTPNRADCLGVRGIARDLAAAGIGKLKPRDDREPVPGKFKSPIGVRFDLAPASSERLPAVRRPATSAASRTAPSPKWLQDRLTAIGLRPISALVDITNFFTFDVNRPLHVFDADKVDGTSSCGWRRRGETIAALNGKSYTLTGEETVIADADGVARPRRRHRRRAVGLHREHRQRVRRGGAVRSDAHRRDRAAATRSSSDARYRFERGVDPGRGRRGHGSRDADDPGAVRRRGERAGRHRRSAPDWKRSYTLRPERIQTLGGVDVPVDASHAHPRASSASASGAAERHLAVTPPSWRGDVQGEADLVEEVTRIYGYDNIPAVPMPRETALPTPALTPSQRRVARCAARAGRRSA